MSETQPELVCNRCAPVEARVAQLEAALRTMQAENTYLAEELQGARATLTTVERQVRFYKAELSKAHEDDPKSQEIKSILETWKHVSGKKRAKIPLDGDRAKLVRTMTRTFAADDLIEAIRGAGLAPYMRFGKRFVNGQPEDHAMELRQIIGKTNYVEENRDLFRRSQADDVDLDRVMDIWEQKNAEAVGWSSLVFQTLARRHPEPEGEEHLDDSTVAVLNRADNVIALISDDSGRVAA